MTVTRSYTAIKKQITAARHYFQMLGVNRRSGLSEIKEARRVLAMYVHPDHNGMPDAHDLMSRVNMAAETLLLRQEAYLIELYSEGLRKCPECKGRGVFEKQQGFNHTIVTTCKECHGAGLR
jgi:DnaJ-class molecular chaperone